MRTIFLGNIQVYIENPMMNANIAYLGYSFICYGMFNYFFLKTFFKSGYSFVKPSIYFFIGEFACIGAFEALHHVLALENLNAPLPNVYQMLILIGGLLVYGLLTMCGYYASVRAFSKVDL